MLRRTKREVAHSPGRGQAEEPWRPALERRRGVSKHRLLTERIIADVEAGTLAAGARMPTQRDLAHRLGVSVQTVGISYKDAEHQGYLRGEVGRGTFVQARVTERADRFMLDRDPNGTIDLSIIRAVYTEHHEAASRALMANLSRGDNSGFMRPCRPVAGLDSHRDTARVWLRTLGVEAERDRVIVTNGAAHALFLAVATVVRAGDVVLTERLTDHGIIGTANLLGFTLRGLQTDDEGILPEAFEAACAAGGVKALVTIPTLTNPTSHVMGAGRRHAIAIVAQRHGVFVIEDEVYKPLVDETLPSFADLIPDLGFFATSFTKSVMTGLRVGYLVVPPRYSIRAASILRVTGWSATAAMAEMASRWVEDGTAAALVTLQRDEVRSRQAIVGEVLTPVLASGHPLSLCALLEVPARWSEDALVRVLAQRGVAVTSSEPFMASGERP
ncbi:MAG: PLP-dependent aminotransferase family protein, partial [Parafilimonas terrae]|nr:PLP-dependent aminotransferase family protein [Parafilimonas terrae]